jgi:hypothetical protein
MKYRYRLFLSLLMMAVILSVSCGPVPFGRLGTASAEFAWVDSADKVSRSISDYRSTKAETPIRAMDLPAPDISLAPFTEFYDKIGDCVASYTPSIFKLWINEIMLYTDSLEIELDYPISQTDPNDTIKAQCYADFTSNYVLSPLVPIPAGTFYDNLFYFFAASDGTGTSTTGGDFIIDNTIEVEMPEYAGVLSARVGVNVEAENGSTFNFELYHLQPSGYPAIINTYLPGQVMPYVAMFVYRKNTAYRAILPGISGHPEMWDFHDPDGVGLPFSKSNGSMAAIFLPFEGIYIPENAKSIRFNVVWDLNGIIEVYDNNTPEKDDDVIVLARDFWNRFSIIPVISK